MDRHSGRPRGGGQPVRGGAFLVGEARGEPNGVPPEESREEDTGAGRVGRGDLDGPDQDGRRAVGGAPATSTGFRALAAGPRSPRKAFRVSLRRCASGTPRLANRSAASVACPPPSEITTKPAPPSIAGVVGWRGGVGWRASASPTGKSSSEASTSIMPPCRAIARKTAYEPATLPVWDFAARSPASERPPLSTTIGFTAVTRRAVS